MEVFDSFAGVTNLDELRQASAKPLRKCVRVNTLNISVEDFRKEAERVGWQLEPVSWCKEGFFIDREDRSQPLGKSLLHLTGAMYVQEASSMLPPVLLGAKPGEIVLDMAAAPGSKTTQVAAAMHNTGVIVANDVQDKRLGTLKAALHRSGVVSAVVMKKPGQWYGQRAVGRFDRVLCDAPCTAMGTVRKDPTAVQYVSDANIGKMSRVQFGLLESAVHAAKVGGTIVYSTCTLTVEENEALVQDVLNKYCDQIESVDPTQADVLPASFDPEPALQASAVVQQKMLGKKKPLPLLRLWPHTYDSEGFFCAMLRKLGPTTAKTYEPPASLSEYDVRRHDQSAMESEMRGQFGTHFLRDGECILRERDSLVLTTKAARDSGLPARPYFIGLPYAKELKDGRLRIAPELATARGAEAQTNIVEVSAQQLKSLIAGADDVCPPEFDGDVILHHRGRAFGIGLARDGHLKNRIPRQLISHFT